MHVYVWYGILQDAEMLTEVTAKLGDFGVAKVGSWSDIAELPKISWKNGGVSILSEVMEKFLLYGNDQNDLFISLQALF